MTLSLLNLLKKASFNSVDGNKLSRRASGLAMALALTAMAGSSATVAQAKEKADLVAPPLGSHPEPGPHNCLPPGPPPGPLFDGPPGPPPPPMGLPLMGVDLSDEQIDRLAQLHTSFMEKTEPAMLKVHSLEHQFHIALASSSINVEELNALRGKIAAEKATVDAAVGDFAVAQAQVLTAEQRHKIKIDMEKFEIRGGLGPHFGPHKP